MKKPGPDIIAYILIFSAFLIISACSGPVQEDGEDGEFFIVTFSGGNASASGLMLPLIAEKGSVVVIPGCAYEYAGMEFAGWALSSGGNVVYGEGNKVTLAKSDLELYAVWETER